MIPFSDEKAVASNVFVITGEYDSITEMVVQEIIVAGHPDHHTASQIMQEWIGAGYLVSQFSQRNNPLIQTANAYALIKMAYEYVQYNGAWSHVEHALADKVGNKTVPITKNVLVLHSERIRKANDKDHSLTEHAYMSDVNRAKNLLDRTSSARIFSKSGRILSERSLDSVDCLWYVIKRLHVFNGNLVSTPRVIDKTLHYSSNRRQVFGSMAAA